jgi:predicted peptidase
MRLINRMLLACGGLLAWTAAAEVAVAPGHQKLVFSTKLGARSLKMSYLLYLPENYEKTTDAKPLLIFLHGGWECGSDYEGLMVHGPDPALRDDPKFRAAYPFIGLSPQCPENLRWDTPGLAKIVAALIDQVCAKYRVDQTRIYMTGLSMGGKGTWLTALEAPTRFAALVPFSAVAVEPQKAVATLKGTAAWIICGDGDGEFTAGSQQMYQALTKAQFDVKWTAVPHGSHEIWKPYYKDMAFYNWLLTKKRAAAE